MTEFKTVAIPATEIMVKGKAMYSLDTANKVLAPIANHITEEAKGGWELHSLVTIPATVYRKKGILERLLGWIPIIGILFRSNQPDVVTPKYNALIFKREV